MKFYAIRLAVALLTFIIGLGLVTALKPFRHDPADRQTEQQILQLENEYIEANLQRDTATLDRILADDFTIHTYCRVVSKRQRLALLQNPDFAFNSISTNNVQVEINGDSATVTGDAVLQQSYQGEVSESPRYRFIRRYEKRQGTWQIVSVRVLRG
ncbi:MAG TPA: nuclear transport factor 2 family protein [Pyrinomonadaceae bacterium]|nr:nuclear transport factor 2 family protein [Pyrinomonadaceae bacterium]